MTANGLRFNPPPGWPKPPDGWIPPAGWRPDPSWPDPPAGWELWVHSEPVETIDSLSELGSGAEIPAGALPDPAEEPSQPSDAKARLRFLEAENRLLRQKLNPDSPSADMSGDLILKEAGVYEYQHPLENAAAYREQLNELQLQIRQVILDQAAIQKSETFVFNNSLAQGRRFASDLARLMLRAYNSEADSALRAMRAGSYERAVQRLETSRAAIARMGSMVDMRISDIYHNLRINELKLTADWLLKKEEEKEAAREERARLREERKIQRELEEERARLDKEKNHLLNALNTLESQGRSDEVLIARLAQIDEAIEQNDYRAANIRAGYIYVISNMGAFGPSVVKIGLTRRLDPQDRIAELSGASVPFRYDVHTLFFSEDAVTLELELHRHFADRALNRSNQRKEFFFATPSEVREVLMGKVGNILEFVDDPEAIEYRYSRNLWPSSYGSGI